jgi:hypothetical protein
VGFTEPDRRAGKSREQRKLDDVLRIVPFARAERSSRNRVRSLDQVTALGGVPESGPPGASATAVCTLEGGRECVAIRTQDQEIFGQIILPVAVDVLDLERNLTGVRIPLMPTAALALTAHNLNDVTTQSLVEIRPHG